MKPTKNLKIQCALVLSVFTLLAGSVAQAQTAPAAPAAPAAAKAAPKAKTELQWLGQAGWQRSLVGGTPPL